MLKENVTYVELMRQANDLSQRLEQIKRDIKQLGDLAGSADPSQSYVEEWLDSSSHPKRYEWHDATSLYDGYSQWMEGQGRAPVNLKRFCADVKRAHNVDTRKHPSTRRVQVYCTSPPRGLEP